jgi:hypothetical protein
MDVVVSPSAIGKRLLYANPSKEIERGRLARQLERGYTQARSDVARFQDAKQLLSHLASNVGEEMFDTEVSGISVEREGAKVHTVAHVELSPNEQVLENICRAAKIYGESFVDKNNPPYQLLWVSKFSGCDVAVNIEESIYQSVYNSVSELGVCLSLVDPKKSILASYFYKNAGDFTRYRFSSTVKPGDRTRDIYNSFWSNNRNVENATAYPVEIGRAGSMGNGPRAVRLSYARKDRDFALKLTVPSDAEPLLKRSDTLQARILPQGKCWALNALQAGRHL